MNLEKNCTGGKVAVLRRIACCCVISLPEKAGLFIVVFNLKTFGTGLFQLFGFLFWNQLHSMSVILFQLPCSWIEIDGCNDVSQQDTAQNEQHQRNIRYFPEKKVDGDFKRVLQGEYHQ